MKVKLLTSRAGNRPVKRHEWEWRIDEETGTSEQVLVEREALEGFAHSAGDVIDVSPAEAKRLVDDGQAELVKQRTPRKAEKAEARPTAEKAVDPAPSGK
jgi:hypothetical protein